MPELTLYAADNSEPVAWRVVRLAKVLEGALQAAASEGRIWQNALVELVDVEGELTAVWKDEASRSEFSSFVEVSWRLVDHGAMVTHQIHEP